MAARQWPDSNRSSARSGTNSTLRWASAAVVVSIWSGFRSDAPRTETESGLRAQEPGPASEHGGSDGTPSVERSKEEIEAEMIPEPNTQAEPIEPDREATGTRARHLRPENRALVARLRAIDPRRAEIVARARTRLTTGAVDAERALRAAARAFLSGPGTGAV